MKSAVKAPVRKPAEVGSTLPTRFEPRFWTEADRRCAVVREIESRVQRMKIDCSADSYQKEILAERAVFILTLLETQEREALEGVRQLDMGQYTQQVNGLVGLLRALGLERRAKQVKDLNAYIAAGGARGNPSPAATVGGDE